MPYSVRYLPIKGEPPWAKVDRHGHVVSRHRSKKKALASIRAYYANNQLVLNANPLRVDPTRTVMIRRGFATDIQRRFRGLAADIRLFLVKEDELGLKERRSFIALAHQFAFRTDAGKLSAFNDWLKQQIESRVFSVPRGTPAGEPWTAKYIGSAYRRGKTNAFLASKQGAFARSKAIGQESLEHFLRSSFAKPETIDKVRLLATRSFEQLRGISSAVASEMNRILAQGLVEGLGPEEIARQMVQRIDSLSKSRGLTIARTEIIHAHAEGQLDGFEELGVDELGIRAEWSTAGDERVCPQCEPLEGKVFDIDEARGMIPLHPNCRCSWIPTTAKKTKGRRRR